MSAGNQLPPKREIAIALLETSSLFLHLDPRSDEVLVPAWFKKQPQLVLQVGLNMAVPIPDLDVGEDAVTCTLSFNRQPHFCRIPWGAVYGLVGEDGRGMIWPDDVPPEVAAQAEGRATKKRGHLRAVPEEAAAEGRGERDGKEEPTKREAAPAPLRTVPEQPTEPAPSATEPSRETDAAAPVAVPAAEAAPPGPTDGGAEASDEAGSPDADQKKGKRELPPYLRIVK